MGISTTSGRLNRGDCLVSGGWVRICSLQHAAACSRMLVHDPSGLKHIKNKVKIYIKLDSLTNCWLWRWPIGGFSIGLAVRMSSHKRFISLITTCAGGQVLGVGDKKKECFVRKNLSQLPAANFQTMHICQRRASGKHLSVFWHMSGPQVAKIGHNMAFVWLSVSLWFRYRWEIKHRLNGNIC